MTTVQPAFSKHLYQTTKLCIFKKQWKCTCLRPIAKGYESD